MPLCHIDSSWAFQTQGTLTNKKTGSAKTEPVLTASKFSALRQRVSKANYFFG